MQWHKQTMILQKWPAIGSAKHPTLVAAVKAAGLVSAIKSKGPFIVFVPTNTAFGN